MIFTCPKCGKLFEATGSGPVACPNCDEISTIGPGPSDGCAWDRLRRNAIVSDYFDVLKTSISDPNAFFSYVSAGRGMFRPWIYALILTYFVTAVTVAYHAGFYFLGIGVESLREQLSAIHMILYPIAIFIALLILMVGVPIATAFTMFLRAGLYHLSLIIVGGARRDFESTFRVVCYSTGPSVFSIIPFIGGLIAAVWQIALEVVGLKVVHGITYGKSLLAVILPIITCFCIFSSIIVMLISGIFAASMSPT